MGCGAGAAAGLRLPDWCCAVLLCCAVVQGCAAVLYYLSAVLSGTYTGKVDPVNGCGSAVWVSVSVSRPLRNTLRHKALKNRKMGHWVMGKRFRRPIAGGRTRGGNPRHIYLHPFYILLQICFTEHPPDQEETVPQNRNMGGM